ncbi:MAG: hypothetical protein ACJ797_02510 [Ktedonobacteraceae bacterium]
MNRGSILCWRTVVGVGVNSSWHTTESMSQHQIVESRVGRPCSVGIRSERVEAGGGGSSYDLDSCGRLGKRDERMQGFCGVSLVRSSRRQPSTTACPGGDDLPQGGVAACTYCVAAPTEERTLEIVICETEKGL